MSEDKENWSQVLEFVNFLDEYGLAYVYEIRYAGNPYYRRQLEHESGSDYWINHLGERVDLAKEHWNTV
jgi:hypothetical protein